MVVPHADTGIMTYPEELREKRKSSLIVVFTLGLAALFMESTRPIWMTNLFEELSGFQGVTIPRIEIDDATNDVTYYKGSSVGYRV